MKSKKAEPVAHVMTSLGVLLGGIIWLLVYASYFGSIEFDGPASLGLGIGLIAGGVIVGVAGIAYDTKHKMQLLKTFYLFVISITISTLLMGAIIESYAQNKWDYAAAHKSECQAPENVRPLACQ